MADYTPSQSWLTDVLSPITGEKPKIAGWEDVILSDAQLQAILGNIKNWGDITRLADLYNTYVRGAYEKTIPGFFDLMGQGVSTTKQMFGTAADWLAGKMSAAEKAEIYRSTAYQNLRSSGATGSLGEAAAQVRSYGQGVGQKIQQGAQMAGMGANAAQLWANIARAMMLDPKQFMIWPQEQWTANYANQLQQKRAKQEYYNVQAAADPGARFLSDLVEYETGQYLSGMGGGGMGGGGGKGMQAQTNWGGIMAYPEGSQMSGTLGPALESGWGGGGEQWG